MQRGRPKKYTGPLACVCGYETSFSSNYKRHISSCVKYTLKDDNAWLKAQLAEKDRQLAAKDRQIDELIKESKRPRTINNTTTNNRYVVEQHINVFGKETLEHISHDDIKHILLDPENAVARFVKLKHCRQPLNANVRCPNINKSIYQVVVDEGGEKEWKNCSKDDVLEKMYDDSSCILEEEATEEDHISFLDHQDKVKASMDGDDGGKVYKDQLDKIHNVVINRN
jgi:hypothetical protein